jgi:hypothetical protein
MGAVDSSSNILVPNPPSRFTRNIGHLASPPRSTVSHWSDFSDMSVGSLVSQYFHRMGAISLEFSHSFQSSKPVSEILRTHSSLHFVIHGHKDREKSSFSLLISCWMKPFSPVSTEFCQTYCHLLFESACGVIKPHSTSIVWNYPWILSPTSRALEVRTDPLRTTLTVAWKLTDLIYLQQNV